MASPPTNPPSIEQLRQDAATRLREFRELRAQGKLCLEGNELFASDAADAFMLSFTAHGEFLDNAVTLLAEIAALDDPDLAEPGSRTTFLNLIEPLSDSFDFDSVKHYDSLMARLIDIQRRLPQAGQLNAALLRFETGDEASLLLRKARLRDSGRFLTDSARPGVCKALVLSRVTLGADVAITSVVLNKLRLTFPNAERCLIGPAKTAELFGGDPTLRILPVSYHSQGRILDRLLNWTTVVELVEKELAGLRPDQYVIVDPDSRLLQLGMLPVVKGDERYFFFESRSWVGEFEDSIGVATAKWLGHTFGTLMPLLPTVWLREADHRLGAELLQAMRTEGEAESLRRPIVAISFGNGGNPAKRAPDSFEAGLLLRLLSSGASIVLDKGFGEDEAQRADSLAEAVAAAGYKVAEVSAETTGAALRAGSLADRSVTANPGANLKDARMMVWQGGIGAWAGLIAASDEFIGYDSAGQHIAAALRVPLIDIFIEPSTAKFRSRWRPAGRGPIRIIDRAGQPIDPVQLIEDVMQARQRR